MATSYANAQGTGYRRNAVLVTATPAFGGGVPFRLVDGSFTSSANGSTFFAGGGTTNIIEFDFGPGALVIIDEFKWYQDVTNAHGTWAWDYFDIGSSTWTQIGATFTLGGVATLTIARAHSTPARKYRLRHTGAGGSTSSTPWLQEIEFKIEETSLVATSATHAKAVGDRTAGLVGVTTDATLGAGTADNTVDGAYLVNATDGCYMNNGQSARKWVFDFGSAVILDKFLWRQGSATGSHGTWQLSGSNDGVTEHETLLQILGDAGSNDFTLGGLLENFIQFEDTASAVPNPGFRYYILRQLTGTTSSSPYITEIEFSLLAGSSPPPATGNQPVIFIMAG
jgi:hypothetical protein